MILSTETNAQKSNINWITFEQLEDSLKIKPKKIFISFYTNWCVYCKKMDNAAFKNNDIIKMLNTKYYAIQLNAETTDTLTFKKRSYINREFGKTRKPTHDIALLLGSRKNKPFTLPVLLILNQKLKIEERLFEYLSPQQLLSVLETK